MIDDKTANLNLPLPHESNLLTEDVPRLRAAFDLLDSHAGQTGTDLADVRTVAEAAAKTATWDGVTGAPEAFPPASHSHDAAEIRGTVAMAASVPWAGVTEKPASFPPAAHGHGWDEVTDKPATYPPASHTHPAGDLTGLQSPFFRGFIAPFYGSLGGTGSKFPVINGVAQTKWHVCDGTDGTPDMRNRVPVGVSSAKSMGSTGGNESVTAGGSVSVNAASVTLSGNTGATTLTVEQMPQHSHPGSSSVVVGGGGGTATNYYLGSGVSVITSLSTGGISTSSAGGSKSHTHPLSGSVGNHSHSASFNGNAVNVVQPYLALHYIMYMG